MLISELCPPVRNTGDWDFTTQIRAAETGLPMWGNTIPADLIMTVTLKDNRGVPRFVTKSNDGSGVVEMFPSAFLRILIPAVKMSGIDEGRYDVHLKIELDGATLSRVLGRISVMEGA